MTCISKQQKFVVLRISDHKSGGGGSCIFMLEEWAKFRVYFILRGLLPCLFPSWMRLWSPRHGNILCLWCSLVVQNSSWTAFITYIVMQSIISNSNEGLQLFGSFVSLVLTCWSAIVQFALWGFFTGRLGHHDEAWEKVIIIFTSSLRFFLSFFFSRKRIH